MIGVTKHRDFQKSIPQNHLSPLALIRAGILTEYYVIVIKNSLLIVLPKRHCPFLSYEKINIF